MDARGLGRGGTLRGWLMLLALAALASGVLLVFAPSTSTGSARTAPVAGTSQALAPQAAGASGGTDNCVAPSAGSGNCSKTFGVTAGSLGPIYPGQTKPLPVTWSNPNSFDILVDSYTVTVKVPSASQTACPANSLRVPLGTVVPNPKPTVLRYGATTSNIPVTLPATAPNGCQGVAFTITVNATAVKK